MNTIVETATHELCHLNNFRCQLYSRHTAFWSCSPKIILGTSAADLLETYRY